MINEIKKKKLINNAQREKKLPNKVIYVSLYFYTEWFSKSAHSIFNQLILSKINIF